MPTTIATPSNANTTIRYNEPYVSAGLNKKGVGSIPNGIVRGGLLSTTGSGLNVQVSPDSDSGDSVYVYTTTTGFQLSHRETGIRTLDLTAVANTTVYVALYVQYSIGAPTLVEWRTYSEAELFTAPVSEAGSVVIVGRVEVPAAGPIPSANVSKDHARWAWKDTESFVKPWDQIVFNGDFEAGEGRVSGTGDVEQSIPGFYVSRVGNHTVRTTTGNARSGRYSLEVSVNVGTSTIVAPGRYSSADTLSASIPVVSGQLIDVGFWLSGTSVGNYNAGTSGCRLVLRFYDASGALIDELQVASDPSVHIGTFAYTKIGGVVEVPSDSFMTWHFSVDTDLTAGSGTFDIDDVSIYMQSFKGSDGSNRVFVPSLRASVLEVSPVNSTGFDSLAYNQRVFRVVAEALGSLTEVNMSTAEEGSRDMIRFVNPFISRVIDILDGEYGIIGTDRSPVNDTVNTGFKLLHRYALPNGNVRVYSSTSPAGVEGINFTVNARWTGTQWAKDSGASGAFRLSVGQASVRLFHVLPGTAGPWSDAAWDHSVEATVEDGDIKYVSSVQRKKFIPLMYLSHNSYVPFTNPPVPTFFVEQTSNYFGSTIGAVANVTIDPPVFVPQFAEVVDLQIGVHANNGGDVMIQLHRNAHDTSTLPLVFNSTWGDVMFESSYTFTGTEERHMLLSDGSGVGGAVLPMVMDYENFDYQINVQLFGVNEFDVTYCFIVYNDFTPGA